MVGTIVFILVLSILILVHELGHFIMARRCGVRVERFSLGFGPKLIALRKGDTEYRISAVPLGGYVKMAGETHQDKLTGKKWEFLSKSPGERLKIIACGPLSNYILGFLFFSLVFMTGTPTLTNRIGKVLDGYPAEAAGIRPGDSILSIDGVDIRYWNELTDIMHKKTDGAVTLEILRENKVSHLEIRPKVEEFRDIFGGSTRIGMIGIAPSDELVLVKYGPIESIYRGFVRTVELTALTFKGIWNLMIGRISLKESAAGPIGIFYLTTKAAEMGFVYILNIIAVISTSLAIFNMLPIPVLDGGHIIFLLIEKVRRKPLSPKVQEIATQVGLSLLILLMLFVSYYDIMRRLGR